MTINFPRTARQPRHRTIRRATTSGLIVLLLLPVCSIPPAHADHMNRVGLIEHTWDGMAIKGYDPVAYFELNRAVKGSKEFRLQWLGQEWLFASAGHRDLFAANPVQYVPQYGGYCTESHSITDIDPTAWRIVDDRLYLFFSEMSAETFARDRSAQSRAEENWRDVKPGLLE